MLGHSRLWLGGSGGLKSCRHPHHRTLVGLTGLGCSGSFGEAHLEQWMPDAKPQILLEAPYVTSLSHGAAAAVDGIKPA